MSGYLLTDKIYAFIRDEVARQGFNVAEPKGLDRIAYMMQGWSYAVYRSWIPAPTIQDILVLGHCVEPLLNPNNRFRNANVMVGGNLAPHHHEVYYLMERLVSNQTEKTPKTPDEYYLEFERIHPFRDGNGRVGKILWNWINNSLHDPILVQNFFGSSNP